MFLFAQSGIVRPTLLTLSDQPSRHHAQENLDHASHLGDTGPSLALSLSLSHTAPAVTIGESGSFRWPPRPAMEPKTGKASIVGRFSFVHEASSRDS
mmetsp:Transcript_15183/g.45886  ORF Transcript_15183/g.45886 Transcript_15183/m.45886 type:complete len:97 (+) Transcript_15183:29-319(+)